MLTVYSKAQYLLQSHDMYQIFGKPFDSFILQDTLNPRTRKIDRESILKKTSAFLYKPGASFSSCYTNNIHTLIAYGEVS